MTDDELVSSEMARWQRNLLDTLKRIEARTLTSTSCGPYEIERRAGSVQMSLEALRLVIASMEVSSDFNALQKALVGDTGLSAIEEAHRLRALHPLSPF